ncbi:MAG TPA: beta-ketoacyl synthase N-terminal-like domain-containing protein [Roseiflexaceae bacterium]|nr:beta-ketoacyl synthase N-terminal-like domain-containing protein [Roseiflexaceae bacterium]
MTQHPDDEQPSAGADIAIIGLACRFPGAANAEAFWHNLAGGVESITALSDEALLGLGVPRGALDDPRFVKAGALLPEIDAFAASFFGYTPREAALMDPQQRVFLECAWEALEHAGVDAETFPGLIGVYAGSSLSTYLLFNLLPTPAVADEPDTFPVMVGNDKDFLSTRVAYNLQLRGPAVTVQTGCSTSLVAVHLACDSLLSFQSDIVLAGGVSLHMPQKSGYWYQEGGITSPDGHCRAFDAQAQGTVFGSGVGVVVLKRLADALDDGDTIHAVIKGSAVNNDGALKAGYTAPSVEGQAEVVARAQAVAQIPAETIGYVEAHGTATPLGDPIEVAALTKAFRAQTEERGFCALGSVKTNIGHLDAAAGVAGLIKTVLALRHGQLPPSLHFHTPNPQIDFAQTPFYVNTELTPWPGSSTPRRAGVSSFGIGGTNAHLILEEAPAPPPPAPARPSELLLLSARSPAALALAAERLAQHLQTHPALPLADVASTLQIGRRAFAHRLALVCATTAEAAEILRDPDSPRRLLSAVEPQRRPVAWLFPGQGAQHIGMGADLYAQAPAFRDALDRCAELLRPLLGLDIRSVLYPNSADTAAATARLEQTALAQPALFAVEYALAQFWLGHGLQPQALIGHSLGEYVAATVAGVFSLEDALALVAVRGRLMQRMPEGAMVSVGLSAPETQELLSADLSIAAINTPNQTVVGGRPEAIGRLEQQLQALDIPCRRLHTTRAFHSPLVDPMIADFGHQLRRMRLNPPAIPVASNLTGGWLTPEEATDPAYWQRHVREPVRFLDGLRLILAEESMLIEVGPGHTLASLVHAHPARRPSHLVCASLPHVHEREGDLHTVQLALAKLWLAGAAIRWPASGSGRQRVPLPTYPFERGRYWIAPTTRPRAQAAGPQDAPGAFLPVWKRTPPRARTTHHEPLGAWLLLDDGSALAASLSELLAERAQPLIRAGIGTQFARLGEHQYALQPGSRADSARLVAELRAAGIALRGVLHLWNSDAQADPSDRAGFARLQEQGLGSLVALAQELGTPQPAEPVQFWAITDSACDVTGQELLQPANAALLGACASIPQEQPLIVCHAVDICRDGAPGDPGSWAHRVMAEIETTSPEPLVAYRNGQRWVRSVEPLRLADLAPVRALRDNGVYMITGGLGGIGSALASHLARTRQARLALIGRTPLPERDSWDDWLAQHQESDPTSARIRTIRALEAEGAEVLPIAADATDEAQMRRAISLIDQRFGTLHGVFHLAGRAGVTALSLIGDLTPEAHAGHSDTKVHGTATLARLLQGRPLDFCALFSSNASFLGGIGLLSYTAAHMAMDALGIALGRQGDTPWLVINWDAWQLLSSAHLAAEAHTLTPAEGLAALEQIVERLPGGQIAVAKGDLAERIAFWVGREAHEGPGGNAERPALHARPLIGTAYVAPRSDIERQITAVWQEALGIDAIGIHDNFFDLGGSSLSGLRVMARLKETLGTEIPLMRLFECPTVSMMVESIVQADSGPALHEQRHSRGELRRELRRQRHAADEQPTEHKD